MCLANIVCIQTPFGAQVPEKVINSTLVLPAHRMASSSSYASFGWKDAWWSDRVSEEAPLPVSLDCSYSEQELIEIDSEEDLRMLVQSLNEDWEVQEHMQFTKVNECLPGGARLLPFGRLADVPGPVPTDLPLPTTFWFQRTPWLNPEWELPGFVVVALRTNGALSRVFCASQARFSVTYVLGL